MNITRRLAVAAISAATLAACAPPPPPPPPPPAPTAVALTITGAADMNGARPAKVKVYYLASAAGFGSADFFALFDTPEAVLGADLLAKDEYTLAPGRTVEDSKQFPTPPSAIGIVAGFRDVGGPGWHAVVSLTPNAPNPIAARLSGNTVKIAP